MENFLKSPGGLVWLDYDGVLERGEQILWPGTAARTLLALGIGAIIEITSGSTSDTAAGIGAQEVRVDYLDTAGLLRHETVAMNGSAPVPLAALGNRLIGATVVSVGTSGANVGAITVSINSDPQLVIPVGRNASSGIVYTVPVGMEMHLGRFEGGRLSMSPGSSVNVEISEVVDGKRQPWKTLMCAKHSGSGGVSWELPMILSALTDFRLSASTLHPTRAQCVYVAEMKRTMEDLSPELQPPWMR